MADLEPIREALAAALKAVPDVQTSAYDVSNPTFPSLLVLGHDEIEYGNKAFGRRDTGWNLIVRGYVSQNIDKAGQQRLDAWLASSGDSSVKQAIEYLNDGDQRPCLGGLVDWVLVLGASGSNIFKLPNGISALGTNFTVQVQTSD